MMNWSTILLDCVTQAVKGIGREKGGLYYLTDRADYRRKVDDSMSNNAKSSDLALWHHRLGHIPIPRLKHVEGINVSLSQENASVCISCPMARFTHLPYKTSDTATKSPFQLIHVDLWGPYRVQTHGNNKYFMTIVDDFSRATWTFSKTC